MDRGYASWARFEQSWIRPVCSVLFLGPVLVALVEVFRRYLLGESFPWHEDFVIYSTLAAIWLYFGVAETSRSHLRVTILLDYLRLAGPGGSRVADLLEVIAHAFALLYVVAMFYWSVSFALKLYGLGMVTFAQTFHVWPFAAVLSVSFAFVAISIVFNLYRATSRLLGRAVLAVEEEAGYHD